jgi:uncharacterized cupin superfamily protein
MWRSIIQGQHMQLLQRLDRTAATPEVERPAPEKVIAGDPVHTTWNLEDRDGLYCGIWQSTPGKWSVAYEEWEYVHILEGVSILTDSEGNATKLQAGDSWVIRPGFRGTWECVETTVKDYVILT